MSSTFCRVSLAPTLVLHCRDDASSPFEQGRLVASRIPGARFVTLESRNHILLPRDPAWAIFVGEVRRFLREDASATRARIASGARPRRASLDSARIMIIDIIIIMTVTSIDHMLANLKQQAKAPAARYLPEMFQLAAGGIPVRRVPGALARRFPSKSVSR